MKQVADSCFIYRTIETALMQEVIGELDLITSQSVLSELFNDTSDRFQSDKKRFEERVGKNSEYEFLRNHLSSLDDMKTHLRFFTSEIESYSEELDLREKIKSYEGPAEVKNIAKEDASCLFLYKEISADKIITDDLEAYNEFLKDIGKENLQCLAEVIIDDFPESRQNKKLVKLLYEEHIDNEKKNVAETYLEQLIVQDYLYNNVAS